MSSIVTKNQKPVPLIRSSTVLLCLTRAFLNLFLRKNPIPAQQIAYIYG